MGNTKNRTRLQEAPERDDDWMYKKIIPDGAFSTRPIDHDGGKIGRRY